MEEKKPIQIEIDETTASGIYSNLAIITNSESEFIFDFIFRQPRPPKAKVRCRIITSPSHAKRFLSALKENISKYEARFGEIKAVPEAKDNKIGFYH